MVDPWGFGMLEGLWVASNACCGVHRNSAQKSVATILAILGFAKIGGYLFGSPHTKDYSTWGSMLGSPYFGKLPNYV